MSRIIQTLYNQQELAYGEPQEFIPYKNSPYRLIITLLKMKPGQDILKKAMTVGDECCYIIPQRLIATVRLFDAPPEEVIHFALDNKLIHEEDAYYLHEIVKLDLDIDSCTTPYSEYIDY